MDFFAELQPGEKLLRTERMHPGVFAIPAVILFLLLLPDLAVAFMFAQIATAIPSFGQPASPPVLNMLWVLIGATAVLPSVVIFLVVLTAYLKCEIVLTTKRLMYRTGLFARAVGELPLENIEATFMLEPVLGRLLGYGTVKVSGLGGAQFPISFLPKPHVFLAVLQRATAGAKSSS